MERDKTPSHLLLLVQLLELHIIVSCGLRHVNVDLFSSILIGRISQSAPVHDDAVGPNLGPTAASTSGRLHHDHNGLADGIAVLPPYITEGGAL